MACWLVTGRIAGEDIGVSYGVCAADLVERECGEWRLKLRETALEVS